MPPALLVVIAQPVEGKSCHAQGTHPYGVLRRASLAQDDGVFCFFVFPLVSIKIWFTSRVKNGTILDTATMEVVACAGL